MQGAQVYFFVQIRAHVTTDFEPIATKHCLKLHFDKKKKVNDVALSLMVLKLLLSLIGRGKQKIKDKDMIER